jgi:SOS response regulatory protein OraA/RecX
MTDITAEREIREAIEALNSADGWDDKLNAQSFYTASTRPHKMRPILAELDRLRAERDALRAEINRLCPSSWDENARAWAEELRRK